MKNLYERLQRNNEVTAQELRELYNNPNVSLVNNADYYMASQDRKLGYDLYLKLNGETKKISIFVDLTKVDENGNTVEEKDLNTLETEELIQYLEENNELTLSQLEDLEENEAVMTEDNGPSGLYIGSNWITVYIKEESIDIYVK